MNIGELIWHTALGSIIAQTSENFQSVDFKSVDLLFGLCKVEFSLSLEVLEALDQI